MIPHMNINGFAHLPASYGMNASIITKTRGAIKVKGTRSLVAYKIDAEGKFFLNYADIRKTLLNSADKGIKYIYKKLGLQDAVKGPYLLLESFFI